MYVGIVCPLAFLSLGYLTFYVVKGVALFTDNSAHDVTDRSPCAKVHVLAPGS